MSSFRIISALKNKHFTRKRYSIPSSGGGGGISHEGQITLISSNRSNLLPQKSSISNFVSDFIYEGTHTFTKSTKGNINYPASVRLNLGQATRNIGGNILLVDKFGNHILQTTKNISGAMSIRHIFRFVGQSSKNILGNTIIINSSRLNLRQTIKSVIGNTVIIGRSSLNANSSINKIGQYNSTDEASISILGSKTSITSVDCHNDLISSLMGMKNAAGNSLFDSSLRIKVLPVVNLIGGFGGDFNTNLNTIATVAKSTRISNVTELNLFMATEPDLPEQFGNFDFISLFGLGITAQIYKNSNITHDILSDSSVFGATSIGGGLNLSAETQPLISSRKISQASFSDFSEFYGNIIGGKSLVSAIDLRGQNSNSFLGSRLLNGGIDLAVSTKQIGLGRVLHSGLMQIDGVLYCYCAREIEVPFERVILKTVYLELTTVDSYETTLIGRWET